MALIDVVKYNGGPNVFAWKFPSDELSTFTQLIVNESQEAILVKDGQFADIFKAGRYRLTTANIPILNNIINLPFGGESPFKAEVWYVNKAYSLDIKWGTPSPIQLQDPKFGIFAPVRANGIFGIRITDSEKFLRKFVGTLSVFNATNVTNFFRGVYVTKVKDTIASYLVKKNVGILEINAHLYINDISVPENDEGVKQLKSALSKRAEMNLLGYDYHQERSFDTLEGAAKNTGSDASSIMGAGLGMAMGVGLGGNMVNNFASLSQTLNSQVDNQTTKNCIRCHTPLQIEAKFCLECGQKQDLSCPQCQQKVELGMKFCSNCGQNLQGG